MPIVVIVHDGTVGVGSFGGVQGEQPDVGICSGVQIVAAKQFLQMIGDIRGIHHVGTVDISLVLRAHAGVREAGEGNALVAVLVLDGGANGGA